MKTFPLRVLSQTKVHFDGEVTSVYAPSTQGIVAILPRHTPFITQLKKGDLKITFENGEEIIPIKGGFINVEKNKTSVLIY